MWAAGKFNAIAAEPRMHGPIYQDRIERNYQLAVDDGEIASVWRKLSQYLSKLGLEPIHAITCVGSVYFENRDFDLTRYALLNGGHHILVRLRTYENYGEIPTSISDYWVEVKIREKDRWRKKRFRIQRPDLADFLNGQDVVERVMGYNQDCAPEVIHDLYRETQETLLTTGIQPVLLQTYRRVSFQNDTYRVCLDSNIQSYHVNADVFAQDSWKYLAHKPAGKSKKTILEFKYPQSAFPIWLKDLEARFPIWRTNFSKYVEGMGFLFAGPLRDHRESIFFRPRIGVYIANSERL